MPYIGNKYEIGDHNNSWKTLDDISSYVATFDGSATNAVSTTNNTIRVPEHRFIQGQRVTYSNGGGGNIGGLTNGTAYYIIHDTNNEFKLATSLANANASTAINLSAVGSGTSHTITAAFDGVNKKFKITYSGGKSSRFTSATQLSVAINNILQRPNDTATFTDGFRISDNEKIEFNVAPVAADIFWGSILSASLPTFDVSDNKLDNFTGNGSTTDFTLSHIPANNESVIVTVNGVVQHPTDKNGTRAYSLDASVLAFTAAPANGDEIQVRHIGFAGATSSSVTGFYGRTGNVTLNSSADNAIVGVITATAFSGPFTGVGNSSIQAGILTVTKAHVGGGTTWGEDLVVTGNARVTGILTVGTNSVTITGNDVNITGVTTASNFKTGTSNLHSSGVEVAGVNVLGADTPIGLGATIYNSGAAVFTGIVTASKLNVTGISTFSSEINLPDNIKASFGTGDDGSIKHTGSNLQIQETTGNIQITNYANDKDVVINSDDGSGGTANYFLADGSTGEALLYHYGNEKIKTTSTGVSITGNSVVSGNVSAATGTFTGNVSIGGVLTYEDVKNIDSVGIVTIRSGGYLDVRTGSSINTNATGSGASGTLHKNTNSGEFAVVSGGTGGNNYLTFYTSASAAPTEKLRINSGGRVNIGHLNQTGSHLDYTRLNVYGQTVAGGTNKNLNLLNVYNYGSGNVGDITGIGLGCGASPGGYTKASIGFIRTGTYGRGDLTFYINDQGNGNQVSESDERLRITSGGEVGINETDPDNKLHVTTTSSTAYSTNTSNTQNITNALLKLQNLDGSDGGGVNNYVGIQFAVANGATSSAQLNYVRTGDNSGKFSFKARNGNGSVYPNLMDITSAGKVGINQTNPAELLHIASTGTAKFRLTDNRTSISDGSQYGVIQFEQRDSNTPGVSVEVAAVMQDTTNGNTALQFKTGTPSTIGERFRITGHGTFGFNTSTIREILHVHKTNSDEAYLRFTNTGTGTGADDGFNIGINSAEQALIWNKENTDMLFGTHGSTRLTIASGGKATFTGEIATEQDYPNQRPTVDWNLAAVKKLDSRITYSRTGPASYVDKNGYVQCVGANVPRFDHDHDTGECKGLLIEGSRTNQIDDSFDLTGSNWVPVNLDRTPFTTETLAPNGKYEATKIILSTASNQHYTNFGSMTKANGAERQCVSFWAKLSSSNYPILKSYITGAGAFTNYSEARFNLSTGVVDGVSGSGGFTNHSVKMTEYPNGWYKCEYEATLNSSETTKRFQLLANNGSSAAGNGTDGYYIWGVQVEVGSFATSHIPTNGSIATRGADFAFLDGTAGTEFDDIYRTDEGTFIIDWFNDPNGNHNDGYVLAVDDGTGNNRIAAVNSNNYQVTVTSGGSSQGTRDLGSINSGDNKIAFTYKLNDQATSLNGSAASVDTSCTLPTGLKYIWFGCRQGAYDHLGGYISRIIYYSKRLSNNQLKLLSS